MKTKNDSPKAEVDGFKQMVREVIAHHFGSKPSRIVHKTSGLSNFVFAVDHAEGDLIVRLSPEPTRINSFIKEQWANNAARKVGVPTAEILEVGNEIIGHPFMITRAVKGSNALHHPERMKIISEMGRYAALINSIPTKNFGATFDWSSNQLSRNEDWKDYLEKELKVENKLQILEKSRAVSPATIKQLQKIFETAAKLKFKPALNHGDIRLKNVIVDEAGKIKAFIDWEDCTSNLAPQWELSLALHDLWIDEKQYFLTGYNLSEKKLREIAPLVKAFNLVNYASVIEQLSEAKDNIKLEQYRTRLEGYLDLYSL
jgi:aminoglycoside phosphotransferase (APT) family kinase protein